MAQSLVIVYWMSVLKRIWQFCCYPRGVALCGRTNNVFEQLLALLSGLRFGEVEILKRTYVIFPLVIFFCYRPWDHVVPRKQRTDSSLNKSNKALVHVLKEAPIFFFFFFFLHCKNENTALLDTIHIIAWYMRF